MTISAAQREESFRETGEITLQIPALPRPTLVDLQSRFAWVRSIERDTSPTAAVTLALGTVLRPNETGSISGGQYERRLSSQRDVVLGYQQAAWLVEHQDEFPDLMALLGKAYIDFPGLVVVRGHGNRRVPCLSQVGRRWKLYWDWLDGDVFDPGGRVASSRK